MNTQFIIEVVLILVFGLLVVHFLNKIAKLKELEVEQFASIKELELDQKKKYQTDLKKQQEEYLVKLFELIKPKFSGITGDPNPDTNQAGPVGTSGTSGISGWHGSSPVFVIPTTPAPSPVEEVEIPMMGTDASLFESNGISELKIVSLSMTNAGGVCMGNIKKKCYYNKEHGFKMGAVLFMDPLLEKPFHNENNMYKLIGSLPQDEGDGDIFELDGNVVGRYVGITC